MYIYDIQSDLMHRNHLKHSAFEKSLISLYNLGSRPQKSPKIAKKKRSLNRDLLNFFLDMVYIRWYLVNPYVQRVQKMSKGGRASDNYGGTNQRHSANFRSIPWKRIGHGLAILESMFSK